MSLTAVSPAPLLLACLLASAAPAAPLAGAAPAVGAPADSGRFALELRAGGAIGQVIAAGTDADWLVGPAWHAGASVALNRFADLAVGYGSSGFGCRAGFCQEQEVDFTSAGLNAGVRVHRGRLWARAGVVRHALRSRWRGPAGAGRAHAPAAIGWEAGAGVAIPLTRTARLTPGLRYVNYRASLDGGAADAVGVLTGDIGVRVAFR